MEKWDKNVDRVAAVNIVFLVTMIIFNAVGFLPLGFMEGNIVGNLLLSQLLVLLPAAYFLFKYGKPYHEAVQLRKLRISDILLCVLLYYLMTPLLSFVNAVSMVFFQNTTTTTVFSLTEQAPWYIGILVAAIIPAIVEETVYRGVFYQEYRKVDPWKAVLLSGFLFALMHGNFNQFCYAFVMGCVFALLIEATGSILSTMVVHFFINAGSVLMVYLYPALHNVLKMSYHFAESEGAETELAVIGGMLGDVNMTTSEWIEYLMETSGASMGLLETVLTYAPSAAFWSVLAFLLFRYIAKRNGNWEKICGFFGKSDKESRSLLTIPLAVAIAIGVVLMFFYELLLSFPQAA